MDSYRGILVFLRRLKMGLAITIEVVANAISRTTVSREISGTVAMLDQAL